MMLTNPAQLLWARSAAVAAGGSAGVGAAKMRTPLLWGGMNSHPPLLLKVDPCTLGHVQRPGKGDTLHLLLLVTGRGGSLGGIPHVNL